MAGITFAQGIDNFVKKGKKATEEYTQEFVARLGEELVDRSPVDTGHYRAMWTLSIGSPVYAAGAYRYGPFDKTGEHTKRELRAFAMTVRAGSLMLITNAARYASYVEYGSVTIEPRFVIRGVLARIPSIKRSVIYRVSRR